MLENKKTRAKGTRKTISGLALTSSLDSAKAKLYALVLRGVGKMEIKDKNIVESLSTVRSANEVTPRCFAVAVELFKFGNSFFPFGATIDKKTGEFAKTIDKKQAALDYDAATGKVSAALTKEFAGLGPACTRAGFTRKGENNSRNWDYVGITAPRVKEIDGIRGLAFAVYTKKGAPVAAPVEPKKEKKVRRKKEKKAAEEVAGSESEISRPEDM